MLGLPIKFDFAEKGMIAFQVGDQEPALIVKDTGKFSTATHSIWFVVDDVEKVYRELRGRCRILVRTVSDPNRAGR